MNRLHVVAAGLYTEATATTNDSYTAATATDFFGFSTIAIGTEQESDFTNTLVVVAVVTSVALTVIILLIVLAIIAALA